MLRLFSPLFFTFIIFSCSFINGAEFPQCDNEPLESFIAVASNCSKAVYCNGVESIVLDCDKDSPYFSTADQKCHNSTSVCGARPFIVVNIPTTTSLSTPTIATTIANEDLISTSSSVTTSRGTTATALPIGSTTSNEESFPTTSMSNQAGTMVTETSTTMSAANTEIAPVFVQCPGVDDLSKPLFLPHPNSCSQYYLCYHGIATLMRCPSKLHFDVTQQSCNTPEEAKCQVNYLIPREKCQLHTMSLYPHPTNCNYYYLCEYGFLMVMQCPFNMYWDYEQRVCTMRSMARCYNRNFI